MEDRLERQLDFVMEIDKLKTILRQNTLADSSRFENDAEHSWHIALAAVILSEYAQRPTDVDRAVRMALVHDLVEIDAGDTFAYDEAGYQTKQAREEEAADRIFGILPEQQAKELRALWEEFDARATPDAMLANAMDRLIPFLHNYMTKGGTWKRHGVKKHQVLARMQPIREAAPALWPVIEKRVAQAVAEGFLQE